MTNIAILGYGTVGSGVVEVINTNKTIVDKNSGDGINIKYVLDLRDFPGDPIQEKITHDFNDIINDDEVKIVVEVMGGTNPAYSFVKESLLKGKSVCTSNKELVAKHGVELLQIAKEKNVNFLFEASVGGGIPIIRPLHCHLTADDIYEITGILNGTTSYMLSKMNDEDAEYDDVLKDAQEKGYAEKNPAADVEGYDPCRKIAILLSIVLGRYVNYEDIYTEGITNISKQDMTYVKSMSMSIKLFATARKTDKGFWARVSPVIIGKDNPLFCVNGVFNGVLVRGNVIDDIMFYGRGAGKLPTASAVVSDIVEASKNLDNNIIPTWEEEKYNLVDMNTIVTNKFVRVDFQNKDNALNSIKGIFGDVEIVEIPEYTDEFAFITGEDTEANINNKLEELLNSSGVENIVSTIRIEK